MELTKSDDLASTYRDGYEICYARAKGRYTAAVMFPAEYPNTIFLQIGTQKTTEQAIAWALSAAKNCKFKPRKEWGL